jgi:hypothetical protein
MLDKDIKVDVFAAQKKVKHIQAKPRTVSFQVGGDNKGSIATTPNIFPPRYVLKFGQFFFEVPPEEKRRKRQSHLSRSTIRS